MNEFKRKELIRQMVEIMKDAVRDFFGKIIFACHLIRIFMDRLEIEM